MVKDTIAGTADKGPDNNKRLAFLESKVPVLIGAVTAIIGRFAPDMELAPKDGNEDLVDVQIRLLEDLATMATPLDLQLAHIGAVIVENGLAGDATALADPLPVAETIILKYADLGKQTAELAAYLVAKHSSAIDGSAGACATAIKVLESQAAALEECGSKVSALEAKVAELEGAATHGVDAEEPPAPRTKARAIGRKAPRDSDELKGIVASGKHFDVVFSDGKKEIMEFEPVRLASSDLQRVASGYAVVPAITVKGINAGQRVAGAGLFVDGELVSYCELPSAVRVEAGQMRQFSRALVFA